VELGLDNSDQGPVVLLDIDALAVVGSPRSAGENPDHVQALAAAQTELPPIIVHRATLRVIDGVHRLQAARLRGERRIAVRFFDGDDADAFVMAVRANIAHGLPLSLADRKRAAGRIITSHPQWSDRRVASVTGIAAGTVADIRRRMPAGLAAETVRIGQDGRGRPVNGAEGRRLAAELINKNPALSLRQIAQAAGISPETARDVRNRLSRGDDPVPKRLAGGTVSLAGRRSGHAERRAAVVTTPPRDRAAMVERLKADPALRFTETGRNLLMLLNLHTLKAADWNEIIDNLPPHCAGIVAQLARDCADVWNDVAMRVERRIASIV
jgi:ParB-like nuclease family protein